MAKARCRRTAAVDSSPCIGQAQGRLGAGADLHPGNTIQHPPCRCRPLQEQYPCLTRWDHSMPIRLQEWSTLTLFQPVTGCHDCRMFRLRRASARAGREAAMDRGRHTVLVVDDSPANRYAVARGLRASGFKTLEASSGLEGLALASMAAAIVLDVNLPDMHGFEVCRTLRAAAATARLPIVHISAVSVSEADQQRARSVGADSYMVDPVDPIVLAFAIDELIGRLQQDAPGDRSGSGAGSVLDQMTNRERRRGADQ